MTSPEVQALLDSITPDQEEQLYLQMLAVSARGDDVQAVCDFGELVFGVTAADHHKAWIEHILNYPRTAATAPPSSAKTTWITTIFMAWWMGKHPLATNAIGSAGDDAADDMCKAIANTIEFSPRWKLVFPAVVPDKQTGWSSNGYHIRDNSDPEWERKRYGNKNPSLVGGGVGSTRWNGLRISNDGLLVLDDIHDRRSKTQQATCDDTVGFFKDTAEYRVETLARLAIVQTRWNPKDIIAVVKARTDFQVFEHPAIVTDADGEKSYWPEVRTLADLQAIRERSLMDFELVFQGNDRAIEGTVLKTEWLHDFPEVEIKREFIRYFGIDFAERVKDIITKSDDPDDFSLSVLVDTGVRLVLEDVFAELLYFGDAEDLFFEKALRYKPLVTGVAVAGHGNKYRLALLNRMHVKRLHYVVMPITETGDKGLRYGEMAPYFKSAQIMVSSAATPGLAKFRAQWAMFPRGHDDTLDSTYNGWHVSSHVLPVEHPDDTRARERKVAGVTVVSRAIEQAYGY